LRDVVREKILSFENVANCECFWLQVNWETDACNELLKEGSLCLSDVTVNFGMII
jgi:hypothetical protein